MAAPTATSAPKRFPDRDEIAAVRAEAELLEPGQERPEQRRLAGRVLARRELGKLVFLDLVDRSGRIQLLCPANRTGPVDVHLGDVVGAIGPPAKSRTGEPSLIVDELQLLSRTRSPLPGPEARRTCARSLPSPCACARSSRSRAAASPSTSRPMVSRCPRAPT